jgi:hypothetical protein
MRAFYKWMTGCSVVVSIFGACSSPPSGLSGSSQLGDDDASSSSSGSLGGGGSGAIGVFNPGEPDAHPKATMVADSACKAGFYQGTFAGLYSSHLTLFGINIPVTGNVELTLNQEGSTNQMCSIVVEGEGITSESCNDVFTLSGGTIQGVADKIGVGDGGVGGFPYYCSMTGTLDCAKRILDNGWIECTYCVGPISNPDAGGALATCDLAGGNFSGPLTANYDTSTLSFIDGTWNGAEVLCGGIAGTSTASCNDGGSPGPEGGAASSYLVPDGGYGLAPHFGGAGTWNASCVDCGHD